MPLSVARLVAPRPTAAPCETPKSPELSAQYALNWAPALGLLKSSLNGKAASSGITAVAWNCPSDAPLPRRMPTVPLVRVVS